MGGVGTRIRASLRKIKGFAKKYHQERGPDEPLRAGGIYRGLPVRKTDTSLYTSQWHQPAHILGEVPLQKVPSRVARPRKVAKKNDEDQDRESERPRSAAEQRDGGSWHARHINPLREVLQAPECDTSKAPLCLVPFNRAVNYGNPAEYMNKEAIQEVVHSLGKLCGGSLEQCFAVCGVSAMALYGFKGRFVHTVTIACMPGHAGAIFKLAKAQKGFYTLPGDMQRFGVPTVDGRIRRVRIMPLERGFERLHKIQVGPQRTPVLSLPGLLDLKAIHYVVYRKANRSKGSADFYTDDMLWILRKIIELSPSQLEHRLTPQRAEHVIHDDFWLRFIRDHSATPHHLVPGLFYHAGLGIPREIAIPVKVPVHEMHQVAPTGHMRKKSVHRRQISGPGFLSSKWSRTVESSYRLTDGSSISSGFTASFRSAMEHTPERAVGLHPAILPSPTRWI